MGAFLLPLAVLVLAALPARADVQRITLIHGGLERAYFLYQPHRDTGRDDPVPLVLALHGAGGDGGTMLARVQGTLNALADRDGWLVVYPEAYTRVWDTGGGAVSLRQVPRVDDLGYLEAVIADVSARLKVDPARIFAAGISRGGQASFLLACRLSGRIRAIVSVAMTMPAYMEPWCADAPPVGMMQINGTADNVVPYEGGRIVIWGDERDFVMSTDDGAAFWRARNGCAALPTAVRDIGRPRRNGPRVQVTEWSDCTSGAPVVTMRIEGGGHDWPTGGNGVFAGGAGREVNAGRVAWEFFRRF